MKGRYFFMKTGFGSVHPVSAFTLYVFIFIMSMTASHPLTLLSSLACATIYDIKLRGKKAISFFIKFIIPVCIFSGLINGFFNNSGETILFLLPWGKNFTLEGVIYGLIFALRTACVLIWLFSFNEVITNDKIIYLFGKISPKTALIVSMALRFIPLIIKQSEEISKAQKGIGAKGAQKSFIKRMSNASKRLSILVSWTLERGIDTMHSMAARGYGLKGRTTYSPFIFRIKDLFILLAGISGVIAGFFIPSSLNASYIPVILIPFPDIKGFALWGFFVILQLFPFIYDITEDKKWSISQ